MVGNTTDSMSSAHAALSSQHLARSQTCPRCKLAQHTAHSPAPHTWLLMTCFASSSLALHSHCLTPHRGTQKKNWLSLYGHAGCRTDGLLISSHELNSHLALQWHLLKTSKKLSKLCSILLLSKTYSLMRTSLKATKINRKGKLSGVLYDGCQLQTAHALPSDPLRVHLYNIN